MRQRAPELVVTLLAAAAAVVWLLALVTSRPPALPVVVVQGEPMLEPGMPWALRFSAVSSSSTSQLPIEGEVRLAGQRAPIADGTARIDGASPGIAEIEVVAGGVTLHGTTQVAAGRAPAPQFTWTPWQREIAVRGAASTEAARDPVYPLTGRVGARLPSRVLLMHADGRARELLEVAPLAQGPVLPDGRVLAVDRSGLQVELAPVVDADEVVARVRSAEPRAISCDLLVDGIVRDVVTVDVAGDATVRLRVGKSAAAGGVRVGGDAAANAGVTGGASAVVHCGGVWPDERGRTAIARLGDEAGAAAAGGAAVGPWLAALALSAGAAADEPILRALDDDDAVGAALARLVPGKVRAARLVMTWRVDRGPSGLLRALYAALALVVVLATLGLGVARLGHRRGAVAAGTVVLAALLAGMYAALIVVAA